ncbi:hypothetical protein MVES_002631 [Malassezia vespertilionis]|uniref:Anaphase-promoting complex subunit 4 WD40 domain-containing protein n=1 Tax=Malassezia vespertilionis TaxID=2020962 RepID=A0A2N1JB00_9BASI|nr:hypothetical protein MVES_002631 [Malassezia vespertilionis]
MPTPLARLACPQPRNFWRSALWSPDGTLFLARAESHTLYVFRAEPWATLQYTFQAPSPVLDVCWYMYPAISDDNVVHWCFAVSCRDMPVRLVDAVDGTTKASFGIVNHVESFLAPQALAFSSDCVRLFGGLSEACTVHSLADAGTNRHAALALAASQHGLVSALAVGRAPHDLEEENGAPLEITAVGTYANVVGIYVTDASWLHSAAERDEAGRHGAKEIVQGGALCLAGWRVNEGHGIVQMQWHPKHRHILVVGMRRASYVYVYNTSYLSGTGTPFQRAPALLARLERPCANSHQRLLFDIDAEGRFLVAGDARGTIRIWDLEYVLRADTDVPSPLLAWNAHTDAIGSTQFCPQKPQCVLSVAGARHWDTTTQGPLPTDTDAVLWQWPRPADTH